MDITNIRVRSGAVTAHGFGARSRLSVIPPTRVRGRAKRRMYARCRIQAHAAQQISLGGEQSVRAAPTLLLRTAPWAHKGSTNAFRSHGSGRHVDAARANRSADRREELVLALRIPVADLYGEWFRLDPMPRARAGGISEELLAVLERLGVAHLRVVMLTARSPGAFVSGDERKWP